MKTRFVFSLPISLLFALGAIASAVEIYDNGAGGPAGGDVGFTSDDDTTNGRRVADDVVLANPVTVTRIDWSGFYFNGNNPGGSDSFKISFYQDAGGLPGALIATVNAGNSVGRSNSGFDATTGDDIYSYSHSGFAQALPAGTVWVAVYNDSTATSDDWIWWGLRGDFSGNAVRDDSVNNGLQWELELDSHLDFQLHGTIDTPPLIPRFESIAFNHNTQRVRITIVDIPPGETFHLRGSFDLRNIRPFGGGNNFTSATSFPIQFQVNTAVNPRLFFHIFEGPSP